AAPRASAMQAFGDTSFGREKWVKSRRFGYRAVSSGLPDEQTFALSKGMSQNGMDRPRTRRRAARRVDICKSSSLGHAAGHKTADPYAFIEPVILIAVDIDWPDHCPPGPVRLSDDGTILHDNPQHVFGGALTIRTTSSAGLCAPTDGSASASL